MNLMMHKKMSHLSFNKLFFAVLFSGFCLSFLGKAVLPFGIIFLGAYALLFIHLNTVYCWQLSGSIISYCNCKKKTVIPYIQFWNSIPLDIVMLALVVCAVHYNILFLNILILLAYYIMNIIVFKLDIPLSFKTTSNVTGVLFATLYMVTLMLIMQSIMETIPGAAP
ncbi:MAG: hypothetical protein LBG97_09150 [Coriobacteriales bacterium]|jgi:hypothetical protein|nr:hypothetical protein [Coriobacteriales bacterium]